MSAYLRLGGAAIVIGLLIASGLVVNGWRKDSARLTAAEARTAEIAREAAETIATLQAQQQAAYEASEQYQHELEAIRSRPAPVRRVVRVCLEADGPPPTGPATPRPDGPRKAADVVSEATGPAASRDIGADLYGLMVEADRCSAQLRGLQQWVSATR